MTNVEETILRAAERLKPKGGLIAFTDLYRALNYSKDAINKGLISLEEQGIIYFSRDNRAHLLKPAERAKRLKRGEDYYIGFAMRNPRPTKKRKRTPTPAQLRARAKFVKMVQARAKAAKAGKKNPRQSAYQKQRRAFRKKVSDYIIRLRDRGYLDSDITKGVWNVYGLIIKLHSDHFVIEDPIRDTKERVDLPRSNPGRQHLPGATAKQQRQYEDILASARASGRYKGREKEVAARTVRARNKAASISKADLAKLPETARRQIERQLGQLDQQEERAKTPAQVRKVEQRRRSLLARLGTRLRLIGSTKKFKVSARDLGRCKTKKISVRSRHATDALAKAKSQLGTSRYDRFAVTNPRRKKNKTIIKAKVIKHLDVSKVRNGRRSVTNKSRQTREMFTGMRTRGTSTMEAARGTPKSLAKLGRLISIKTTRGKTFRPPRSRQNPDNEIWLTADDRHRLHLAANQLPVMLQRGHDFGEIAEIEYETPKPHLGYRRSTLFFHHLGEEGGARPHLVSDREDGALKIVGGDYRITERGLED